jgi:hypothetical protein
VHPGVGAGEREYRAGRQRRADRSVLQRRQHIDAVGTRSSNGRRARRLQRHERGGDEDAPKPRQWESRTGPAGKSNNSGHDRRPLLLPRRRLDTGLTQNNAGGHREPAVQCRKQRPLGRRDQ